MEQLRKRIGAAAAFSNSFHTGKRARSKVPPISTNTELVNGSGMVAVVAATVGSVVAIVMSAMLLLARHGFPTPLAPVFRITGLTLLALNSAVLGGCKWWRGPGAIVLYAVALLGWLGYLPSAAAERFGDVGACSGYAWFAVTIVQTSRRLAWRKRALVLAVALLIGVYFTGTYWGFQYRHPLSEYGFQAGQGHIDVPFNASVANMIRTYGMPSTGLDGIPFVRYHFGSHWLAAGIAGLCGANMFETYSYLIGILLMPLFVAMLLLAALHLRRLVWPEEEPGQIGGYLLWCIFIVGVLSPFPKKGDMLRLSLKEVFASDSYALGLTLSFSLVGMAVDFYRQVLTRRRWGAEAAVGLLLVFPVLLSVCGMVKISMMYLLGGLAIYGCWRLGLWRRPLIWGHIAIAGMLLLFLLRIATGASESRFSFFNFDRIHIEWLPYFFLLYYFWAWAVLLLRAWQLRLRMIADLQAVWEEKQTLAMELVVVCSMVGLIPYLLMDFGGGGWNYFTQYQTFLGLLLVLSYVPEWEPHFQSWRTVRVATVVAMGVGILMCFHLGTTTIAAVYAFAKIDISARCELAGYSSEEWRSHAKALLTSEAGRISPQKKADAAIFDALHELAALPLATKRNSVLYIPKTNRAYWGALRQPLGATVAFMAPAISGIAMVDGLPEAEDDLTPYYRQGWSFPLYDLPKRPEPPTSNVEHALQRARALGFRELIVLDAAQGTCCRVYRLEVAR